MNPGKATTINEIRRPPKLLVDPAAASMAIPKT
jgi:hypothetical protein